MISCQICGAEGVNRSSCPLNPDSKCPNYDKHYCAMKGKKKKRQKIPKLTYEQRKQKRHNYFKEKYNLTQIDIKEILVYSKDNRRDMEKWCKDLDYLKLNYSIFKTPILLRMLNISKNELRRRNSSTKFDIYNDYNIPKYRFFAENLIYHGLMKRK